MSDAATTAREETIAFQRATIDHLLTVARQSTRISDIMAEQAQKALEIAQALAAQVHAGKVESDQLKADAASKDAQIANLQDQVATLSANAEDPATMQSLIDTLQSASNELKPPPAQAPEQTPTEDPAA